MFKEYDKNTYKEKEVKDRTPFRTSLKKMWNDIRFWRFMFLWAFLCYLLSRSVMIANAAELPNTENELEDIILQDEESLEEIIPPEANAPDEITLDEVVSENIIENDLNSEIFLSSNDGTELTEYQTQVLTLLEDIKTINDDGNKYINRICLYFLVLLFFEIAAWTTERVKVIVRRFSRYE